jgi:sulfoxide reductase heme-binding subunit YedZ
VNRARRGGRALQATAVSIAIAPLALLVARFLADDLGANPIEEIAHTTGDWTLRFLLLCLAVTPVRRLLRAPALAPLRRSFGLTAFGYAVLHLFSYVGLDQGFAWETLFEDVRERRFVTAGLAAFLCLLPLALTSTRHAQRRLGRRWRKLHRLVYAAAVLGVVHYLWLVKADLRPPLAYAAVLAALLASRLPGRLRGRLPGRPQAGC